jgi:hypothetical protein
MGFRAGEIGSQYQLGEAFSEDGETWTRLPMPNGLSLSTFGWDSKMMCYPHVFSRGNETYLLYNGDDFGKHGFGIAKRINSPEK